MSSRGISSWGATLLLIAATIVGATLVYISYWHTLTIEQETLKRSAQSYSRAFDAFRSFYSQQILERLHSTDVEVTHDYKAREKAIPIPATMTLELANLLNRTEQGQSISIVSQYPFPWREKRALSGVEARALDEFKKTPSKEYSELQDISGEKYLFYATPMRMSAGCVECHNSHPDSPKADWQIGDVRGLQIVQLPVGEITDENRLGLAYLITFILFSFICAFSIILWLVGRNQLAFAELNTNAKVLKRTNAELKSLKDAIDKHAIVSIADRDGTITDANDLFCEISGYSKEELIGKNHRIIRSGEHPEPFFAKMWSTIQSGQIWKGQIKNRSKDGDYYWVNSTIVPYLDENRVPFQYIAIRTDISAIKKLEEETERNRRFLASITDALGEGVIATDAVGRCTFANPEARRLLNLTHDQLIGQSMRDVIPDACHSQILDAPTETYRSDNLTLQRIDGRDFDAAVIAVPMFEDGAFAGSVIAFQNISDRKTAENALKLSEERFRQVASTAQEAIITADQDGRIIFWNNAAIRTFGYEVDEILNKPLSLIVPHTLREGHRKGFKKAIENGELVHQGKTLELPALRKNGAEIITEVVLSTWIADGKRYFTAMARDITERKQLMVDLADATREAETANRAKSDFLANMSHEIRTPMNAIIGLSHLALQTDLSPKQLDYLDKIQNASKLLLGIINDILDISKIEAGQMEIEAIPFNLMDVLDGVIAVTAHKAVEKNIEFLIDISADVAPDLVGDPLRLGQILNNLVSNAVKFTTHGEVLLSVYQDQNNDDVLETVFEVRDTGVGMSADQMKKLFRPFTQADVSTTRRFGGTGLGLAISKRMIDQMDGMISVDSTPDQGSTFTIRLPMPKTNCGAAHAIPDTSRTEDLRALVVDDNQTACEILTRALQTFGITSQTAASAEKALETIATSTVPFDLIFVDWVMPGGMDGIDFSRAVAEDDALTPKPHVFLATSFDRNDALAKLKDETWCKDVLQKPINHSTLLDTINSALGGASIQRSPSTPQKPRDIDAIEALLGARVLIAEDNAINQQVITELSEDLGLQVTMTGTGQEVLDLIRTDADYDAILMDVQMPVMDGLQATRALRDHPLNLDIPIIALTAHATEDDRKNCLDAGMNDYLRKPIEPEELFETLSRWVKARNRGELRPDSRPPKALSEDTPLPSDLPGINLRKGLHYMGNRSKTYAKLLVQMWQDHRDADQTIRDAVEAGDQALALRTAHSMKSLSKTLGAEDLSNLSLDLETKIGSGLDKIEPDDLSEFSAHLKTVMGGIAQWHSQDKNPQSSSAADLTPVELFGQLEQLQTALENGDTVAQEILESISPSLMEHALSPDTDALINAIEQFEFDEALPIVNKIKSRITADAEDTDT